MEKTTNFSDLNKDIIIAVLSSCDVRTVVRVEQTCRDLRDLISSRHLWLTLIQNLDHDHAPALLPHETLQSLSVERLRDLAIRSVRGRLNWTSSKGPKVTRTTVLKLNEEHEKNYNQGVLAPGGKYFVFTDSEGCFHCYDTEKAVNVCSYHPPFDGENVDFMDCLIENNGYTLILAYIATFPFSGGQRSISVVRLDVQSGTSSLAQSYSLDHGHGVYGHYERDRIRLTNEVVVAAMPSSIFVANWRTGEAALIERMALFNDFHIAQGHILCAIHLESCKISFVAAPLSLIFAVVTSSTTGKKGNFSSPVAIQSETVFIHVLPLALPEAEHVSVVLSSVCTESWRCPSLRESDAIGVTTRILLCVYIYASGPNEQFYMVNHLEFSPIKEPTIDDASRTATIGSASTIDFILTCQRQSPLYLFHPSESVHDIDWVGTSRAGHTVGTTAKLGHHGDPTGICAVDLPGLVEGPVRETHLNRTGTDFGSVPKHHMLVSNEIRRPENLPRDGIEYLFSLNVEEYRGALWYFYGESVYIYYFD